MNGAWKMLFPVFLGVLMALIAVVLWKAVRKKEGEGFEDGATGKGPGDIAPHAKKALEEIRKRNEQRGVQPKIAQEGFQTTPTSDAVVTGVITTLTEVGNAIDAVQNVWKNMTKPTNEGTVSNTGYVVPLPATPAAPPQATPYNLTFSKTPIDKFYDIYADDQYAPPEGPPPETITIKEEELPDYGASLSAFDTEVLSIPWDSDNKDLLPRDVLWGNVSPEASKAIFKKTYNRTLFGNVNNLQIADDGKMQYYSPALGVTAESPETIMALQSSEAVFSAIGNLAMDAVFEAPTANFDPKGGPGGGPAFEFDGKVMSEADVKAKFGIKGESKGLVLKNPITKDLMILNPSVKFAGGARKMSQLAKKISPKIAQKMAKIIARVVAKCIQKSMLLRAISLAAATVASLTGVGAVFAWGVVAAINSFLGPLDLFVMAIAIVLTPIFDRIFDSNGKCPPGTTAITDLIPPAVYWTIENVLPLGDLLSLTGPYLCSKPNGEAVPKKSIGSQPYYEDSTLSLYYHNWRKDEIPRAPVTQKKKSKVIPAGFAYCVNDTCYKDCPTGSYNRTEVDTVCYRDEYAIDGRISTEVFNEAVQCKESEVLLDGLCYPICKDGFTRMSLTTGGYKCVASGILASVNTRETTQVNTIETTDPGYNPDEYPLASFTTLPWCNFASPVMMDRMAQFYYDQSFRNAYPIDNSGTVQFEFIYEFIGVIASSELTCDVACNIRTLRFNPITGQNFTETWANPPNEMGDTLSYRRFYFVKGPNDEQGTFTVTGCTNTQYTAPDAMKSSLEALNDGEEYVPSVPKVFEITKKGGESLLAQIVDGAGSALLGGITSLATIKAAKSAGRRGGAVAGAAAGAGVGIAAVVTSGVTNDLLTKLKELVPPDDNARRTAALAATANYPGQDSYIVPAGSDSLGNSAYILINDTPDYFINRGPIKELATGYSPAIQYCKDAKVLSTTCAHKYVLRDVIAKYQAANPGKRVKLVTGIEPRGGVGASPNGCWYRWKEVDFDVTNNTEGSTQTDKEIVQPYIVGDNLTCVMQPLNMGDDATFNALQPSFIRSNLNMSRGLAITNGWTANGTTTVLWDTIDDGRAWHKFKFSKYGQIIDSNSNKCLAINSSTNKVEIQDCLTTPRYIWNYDTNTKQIKSMYDNRCMDAIANANGSVITANTCSATTASQKWTLPDAFTNALASLNKLDTDIGKYTVRTVATVENGEGGRQVDNARPSGYTETQGIWYYKDNIATYYGLSIFELYTGDAEYNKMINNGIIKLNIVTNRSATSLNFFIKDSVTQDEFIIRILSSMRTFDLLRVRTGNTGVLLHSNTLEATQGTTIYIHITNTYINIYKNNTVIYTIQRLGDINISNNLKIGLTGNSEVLSSYNKVPDYINILNFSYIPITFSSKLYPTRKLLKQTDVNKGTIPFGDTEREEVFAVGPCNAGATFTKTTAATKCAALGARAATFSELLGAYAAGADWCCPGWLSDQDSPHYPITTRKNQCGGGSAGVKIQQGATTAAAICYGIKPAKGADPAILDFNESSYYQNLRTAPIFPRVPFAPPISLPPETVLGGPTGPCPTRKCSDRAQIEQLMADFNSANADKKILKVTKAWTPAATRCDYEVELRRKRSDGKEILSKETLRIDVRAPTASETACIYRRTGDGSASLNSGTYIMADTPDLQTTGANPQPTEVKVSTNVVSAIKTNLATALQPALTVNLSTELVNPTKAAAAAAKETLQAVAANQGFTGCADTNICSRPAVLAAIQHRYNSDFGYLEPFGSERNLMKRVLRSKVSGPNTCDVQFENLYEYNEDILYTPKESDVSTLTYRFKLTGGQGCDGWKAAESGTDISGSSIVLSMTDSQLAVPFTKGTCTFSCGDAAILREVKRQLDTKYSTRNLVQSFQTVTQSFRAGNEVCEYTILKNRIGRDPITKMDVDDTDVETVVRAELTLDPVSCSKRVDYVEEFSPEEITTSETRSGEYSYYRRGVKITVPMPALFFYDPATEVSKKVSTKVLPM